MPLGIHAIGTSLPAEVRTNDWWDDEVVASWGGRMWDASRASRTETRFPGEGARRVLAALEAVSDDPFGGAGERRVLLAKEQAVDLEVEAARRALEAAEVEPGQIDLLLGFTLIPDQINAPNVCRLHELLGLPAACITLEASAICNSFQLQLALAEGLIGSGRATLGLLVQSSAISRVTTAELSNSVHMGDGATAVVVGPVSEGRGLITQAHRTDGSEYGALVCTVPGKRWWEEGRVITQSLDHEAGRRMAMRFADRGREVVGQCLEEAGLERSAVDFFACHQATAWFRTVMQEHIGLTQARSLDTYPTLGSLSAANLPMVMATAQRDGLLRDGDLVAMYQGGTGATYSGSLLRWGR